MTHGPRALSTIFMICFLLLGMTTSQAGDDRPLTHTFAQSVIDEVERRDTRNIGFKGNEKYSATALRRALAFDDSVIRAVWADKPSLEEWSGVSWAEYATTVADRVLAGYQLAGYLNASVVPLASDDNQPLTLQIVEGPNFICGQILVTGVDAQAAARIRADLTDDSQSSDGNFTIELISTQANHSPQPAIWSASESADTSEVRRMRLQESVIKTLKQMGYSFCECRVDFETDLQNQTVVLKVSAVPGRRNVINDLRVSGLQNYTHDDVKALLNLQPGTEASPDLCRRLEAQLTSSGRFLFAACHTDTTFGSDQPVSLNVHVREFEERRPQDTLSDVQQAILKYGDWLNNWSKFGPDLEVSVDLNVQRILADRPTLLTPDFSNPWADFLASLDRVNLSVVVSPTDGAVVTAMVTDQSERVLFHHSLLHTKNLVGIISHEHQRSLLMTGEAGDTLPSLVLSTNLQGVDQRDSHRRLHVFFRYGVKSEADAPVIAAVNVNATALLCAMTSRVNSDGTPTSGTAPHLAHDTSGRAVVRGEGRLFDYTLDAQTGGLLSATVKSEMGTCLINPAPRRLQQAVAKLLHDTQGFHNTFDSEQKAQSIYRFVAGEIRDACDDSPHTASRFVGRLLSDPAVCLATEKLTEDISARHTFKIPAAQPRSGQRPNHVTYLSTMLAVCYWLTPETSELNRVASVLAATAGQNSTRSLIALMLDAIRSEQFGPTSCAATAFVFNKLGVVESGSKPLAVVGLRRLSTERLVTELSPLLDPNWLTGAIANAFVRELRVLNDEEFEELVAAFNVLELKIGENAIKCSDLPVRSLLTSLRQQTQNDPDAVLHAALTTACSETQGAFAKFLTDQAYPPEAPHSFFRASRSETTEPKQKKQHRSAAETIKWLDQ